MHVGWSQKDGTSPKREQSIQSVGSTPTGAQGGLQSAPGARLGRLFSWPFGSDPSAMVHPREEGPPSFGDEGGWARYLVSVRCSTVQCTH